MSLTIFALIVYLAWSAFHAAQMAFSLRRGRPEAALLLAVEKAAPEVDGEEKNTMAKGFLWISLLWLAASTAVAALAYGAAARGSAWGLAVFIAAGGWLLYQAASAPFVLRRMYPGRIGWKDWLGAAIDTAVWLLLFGALAPRWVAP